MSAAPNEATAQAAAGKQTTIGELKPVDVQNLPQIRSGFDTLQTFELMQRQARLLAASTLVPEQYRNNISNCVIALNMAQRIGADPLMVMQNLYVVHGRPSWSAQFLIACFNQCGRFAALRYRFSGTVGKDDWTCQAYSKELATGENILGPEISIALSKKEGWYEKKGSKWQTIPQLMLMYRAASWLVRTHAPEIAMGLQTEEELHDVYEARRSGEGTYSVDLESLRGADANDAAAAAAAGDASGASSPGDQKPADDPKQQTSLVSYTKEEALQALKEVTNIADLNKAWVDINLSYEESKRELEPELDETYKSRRTELTKL